MKGDSGYIIVLTGNGKGKTTSALGIALRAIGQGLKVAMLQLIKGSWQYGELGAAKRLGPDLVIQPLGTGFVHVNPANPDPADIMTARKAWEACKETLLSGRHDMVILDEINNTIAYGLLSVEEVLKTLQERPKKLHVVLTGRDADPKLIEAADLVTEVNEIKHPYQKGAPARKGIEF